MVTYVGVRVMTYGCPSELKDRSKEVDCLRFLWVSDYLLSGPDLVDQALMEVSNAVGHITREANFVGHEDHCHALF